MKRSTIKAVAFTAVFFVPILCAAEPDTGVSINLSRLVELISLKDTEEPLYRFSDFEEGFDEDSFQENIQHLKENPHIVKKIQSDLGGGELRWELSGISQRLLFVPENREEYATLYEGYCRDVTRYVADKTGLEYPYCDILTLRHEKPALRKMDRRVTAFLVHNLAKEFVAVNTFSGKDRKKVKLEIKGRLYPGEIGSYSSYIVFQEDGSLQFVRNSFTLWQNSAGNPYTALMTPAEETLHIALREYTERAILEEIQGHGTTDRSEVRKIADNWLSVEEAIVGGVVHTLIPEFLQRSITDWPGPLITDDSEFKSRLKKYRYLQSGMEIVRRMGYEKAIAMYVKNPADFRKRLVSSH